MTRIFILVIVGTLLPLSGYSAEVPDPIVPVRADDQQMEAAIKQARSTLPHFFQAMANPKPNQKSFLVKVAFRRDKVEEHIWVADLSFAGKTPRGVVANEPKIKGIRFMEHVSFDRADVSDWMYLQDGRLIGGYTTRLIRGRLSPEERKEFDASAPYKI